jgi:hypothetical protein
LLKRGDGAKCQSFSLRVQHDEFRRSARNGNGDA